ncbi:phage antirepressor KilAC domain-containing protein [Acinetobacter lwoffii]|uniref:phage antirepressor KilAC domain-containing protein n=1 Tax=Acinetobacter lwoffii TaxID=28090 RepID=UPI002DBE7BA2|nr:phage antirepressor KilAC domain-containing protein [Acinetobacter lwoffii]MEB6680405.1 phage antirepressor KilAC domain-containing protein [Acinetobacter lwoffii]
MNMLAQFSTNQASMSSRDLLDLINQVRSDLGEPLLRLNSFNLKIEDELDGENYTKNVVQNFNNTESVVFELTIDQCMLIGMRESKAVRKNVLAILKQKQLPQSFSEALQLAADQARQLELAAPKVQYFDRVADTKNLLNASQVGKKVGMSVVKLNQYLADMGVYDRRIAGRTFAQWFIDKGYGEVKQTEQGYPQSKFTNKGEQWVIERLVSEGVVQ